MSKGLLGLLMPKNESQLQAEAHTAILRQSAKIGGTVFGPIPKGVHREFFCLDAHTWVWHEEWTDEHKVHHARTTRYDVRPHGIFKAQDGQPYQPLSSQEAVNLYYAMQAHNQAVKEFFIPRLAPGV
jgi:hypothetical protein